MEGLQAGCATIAASLAGATAPFPIKLVKFLGFGKANYRGGAVFRFKPPCANAAHKEELFYLSESVRLFLSDDFHVGSLRGQFMHRNQPKPPPLCRCELVRSAMEGGLPDVGVLEQMLDRLAEPRDNPSALGPQTALKKGTNP